LTLKLDILQKPKNDGDDFRLRAYAPPQPRSWILCNRNSANKHSYLHRQKAAISILLIAARGQNSHNIFRQVARADKYTFLHCLLHVLYTKLQALSSKMANGMQAWAGGARAAPIHSLSFQNARNGSILPLIHESVNP
jgi:hypothetical protein